MIAPHMDPLYSAVCIAALFPKQMAATILSAAALVKLGLIDSVGIQEHRIDR